MRSIAGIILVLLLLVAGGGLGWMVYDRWQSLQTGQAERQSEPPAPVEVAAVETGPIALRRTFSGTLEAPSRFIVAPKVSGRIERLHVDLSDPVQRGQVVAELDNDEYEQELNAAEADLAVAKANVTEAENAVEIADRELQRVQTLRERGVASESQLDVSRADQLAKAAQVEVARAQLMRAEASLETARIRLGYTTVAANWTGGDDTRVVGEKFVNVGDTVSANAPLFSIVELDPITGVIFVTEEDYARLRPEQPVTLTTDAYPGRTFQGRIARIAPVFQADSRQARVELTIPNAERWLKPGMFIRAEIVLERIDNATIVPAQAVTRRNDEDGVFRIDETQMTVHWKPVTPGIREGDRLQLLDAELMGRVVTLGLQMIDDGSKVTISTQGKGVATSEPAGEATGG